MAATRARDNSLLCVAGVRLGAFVGCLRGQEWIEIREPCITDGDVVHTKTWLGDTVAPTGTGYHEHGSVRRNTEDSLSLPVPSTTETNCVFSHRTSVFRSGLK